MRRVAITGANRGIGLELTRVALERGDLVLATCRAPAKAEALHALGGEHPETLHVLPLDLLEQRTHRHARGEIEARTGALDILINCAGIYVRDPSVAPEASHRSAARLDQETMIQMLRVNAVAPLMVTREVLPLLRRGTRPRVVFLSSGMGSIGGKDGREIEYSYSASKAALNMLARVLSYELRDEGISVVSVSPGWVATEMGGPRAPIEPDEAASRLWGVIDGVDLELSGSFLDLSGRALSW